MLPDERRETVVRVLCAWAAEACHEHVRSQLRGLVLYAVVPSSAVRTKRFKIPAAWRAQCGYRNIFKVPTANDAWTSDATRTAPFRVDDFYMEAPPRCTTVLMSSKRAGEACGRVNCKRHRKDDVGDSSTATPSTSGGSSPASAGSQNQSSAAAQ